MVKNRDLKFWSDEWEKQQNSLIEKREERFETLFDITEVTYGKQFNALDLGCGPGSLEKRFLARFPKSTITSIDYDPVTLELAKVSGISSRVKFLERDLRSENWDLDLDYEAFDVVYSTTALHWLTEKALRGVYRKTALLLKPEGILINGDHMRSEKRPSKHDKLYTGMREKTIERSIGHETSMGWDQWWNEFKSTGWRPDLFEERERRLATGNHDQKVSLEAHVKILMESEFRSVEIPWKYLDNVILLAMK